MVVCVQSTVGTARGRPGAGLGGSDGLKGSGAARQPSSELLNAARINRPNHPVRGIRQGSISRTTVDAKRGTFSVSCIEVTRSPRSPLSSTERT